MHGHVGKHAKKQKNKESQTGGTKQARQAWHHHVEWRKLCIKHTNITEMCLTSGQIQQAIGGTDATTQASGLKDQQAQAHRGHKAWQKLDLDI